MVRAMSKSYLTLNLGVLLAASGFAVLHLAEPRVALPGLKPDRFCLALALRATPSRLITQVQTGASALFNCAP